MTTLQRFLVAALSLVLTIATSKAQEDFTSLFNGKDLSGWTLMGDQPASFRVEEEAILCTGAGNYPNWLRSQKEYENFVLRLEFMTLGWSESGLFIHSPLYGRPSRSGIKIALRHDRIDEQARSTGSIYDVLPPSEQAGHPSAQWNQLEIYSNWPEFRVTLNGRRVQNVNLEQQPDLRLRLRRGYIGLQDIGTRIRFRKIEIRELPSQEKWKTLFNGKNLEGWSVSGPAQWSVQDNAIVGFDGDGYLISRDSYSRYEFQVYVRTSEHANGGLQQRWQSEQQRGYEVQIYNVIDATNPTGSLYGIVPASDPDARDGEWFLVQMISDGPYSCIRINGKTVAEANQLELPDEGKIVLQLHQKGARIEFLNPKVKALR